MTLLAFSWMLYGSDDGRAYALKVDNDYVNMGERGWVAVADPTSYQYPRGWLPRRVIGIAPDGRMREAIVCHVDALLWNGGATTFQYRDSSGEFVTANVIGRRQERWLRIPSPDAPPEVTVPIEPVPEPPV